MDPGPRDERFSRQVLLPGVGRDGQRRLAGSRVVIAGCGATGGMAALLLARAGVGSLRLVDRDLVERSNLPRQPLFEEADAEEELPKAVAAARALARVDSSLELEPCVADLNPGSARELLGGADLVVDGMDNFPARYAINELTIATGVPWVHTAAVGTLGQVLAVVPGATACLVCFLGPVPPDDRAETCETAGVLGAATAAVGAQAAALTLRLLLVGQREQRAALGGALLALDLWAGTLARLPVPRRPDCPACVRRESLTSTETADGRSGERWCGQQTVQFPAGAVDVEAASRALEAQGVQVVRTPFLRAARVGDLHLSLFPDGRVLVRGTSDPARARALYDRLQGGGGPR